MPTDQLDFVLDPSAFQDATGWVSEVSLFEGLDCLARAMTRHASLSTA
jgi:dTDP-4-keto-6-deoxyhexose 4-ketoreductase